MKDEIEQALSFSSIHKQSSPADKTSITSIRSGSAKAFSSPVASYGTRTAFWAIVVTIKFCWYKSFAINLWSKHTIDRMNKAWYIEKVGNGWSFYLKCFYRFILPINKFLLANWSKSFDSISNLVFHDSSGRSNIEQCS